jgi:NADH-quinone oxidoreductase subunit L
MWILDHLWLIPALPLLGAAVNGLAGKSWPHKRIAAVAVGSTGLSFLFALEMVREFAGWWAQYHVPFARAFFPWIVAGSFRADFALHVDQLTVVMVLVVTGVGWLIHIYSIAYMEHEGGYYRFFSYLNLFMFFMLVLVLAANYALLFVGWEGVGLCSYLLIGFFFLKKSASDAGKKAFIVNRIGDFGFMLAMFLMFRHFGSLDFEKVFQIAASYGPETGELGFLTAIGLLMLAGATGKSAQIPLYVWLPDAMEGPTPVSALIHAATMVTAGVYVVARSSLIYTLAPTALMAVALVGCITAIFAATIGLAQNDIKRVLAYSTVSQLGYMFLACGVGAFWAGIFHLMTHAFFKALLFLGAGSVIHAMGGEQDIRKMGGLRKKIPVTFWTMLAGTLAISGAPLFSGFFSKDAILWKTASSVYLEPPYNRYLWAIGLGTAILTALYMFRMLFLTFFGAPRFDEHEVHVHESPRPMLIALVALAVLSVVGGFVGVPESLGGNDAIEHFLAPVFHHAEEKMPAATAMHADKFSHDLEYWLMGMAVFGAAAGVFIAYRRFLVGTRARLADTPLGRAVGTLLGNKYYVDEFYNAVVVQPIKWISTRVLWQVVDERGIDGTVNGLAHAAGAAGERARRLQSGNARSYAAWVVVGAFVFTTFLIWLAVVR